MDNQEEFYKEKLWSQAINKLDDKKSIGSFDEKDDIPFFLEIVKEAIDKDEKTKNNY